jgi:NAD+ kinase
MEKIAVIIKQTKLQRYLDIDEKILSSDIAKNWKPAHDRHIKTVDSIIKDLNKTGINYIIMPFGSQFNCDDCDLIISVGGDGTFLSASHYINNTKVMGVNSDPETSVGFFCKSNMNNFNINLLDIINGNKKPFKLTRMILVKNNKLITDKILNEAMYTHSCPAMMSNYILTANGITETHKSSGFWVGPAAGATGARRSAGGSPMDLSSTQIQLLVRERYWSPGATKGPVEFISDETITAVSKMDNGAIYIDGNHNTIPINIGDVVEFKKSENYLYYF